MKDTHERIGQQHLGRTIVRPRACDAARVEQVIVTESIRGGGMDDSDLVRRVTQYWSFDGTLLAESDPATRAQP